MVFVTDSNRPQPLWQPPPTACLTAGDAKGPVLQPPKSRSSTCRVATSICQPRHDQMDQGPAEPHPGRSTFLLSSGGAGGAGITESSLIGADCDRDPVSLPDTGRMSVHAQRRAVLVDGGPKAMRQSQDLWRRARPLHTDNPFTGTCPRGRGGAVMMERGHCGWRRGGRAARAQRRNEERGRSHG